MSYLQKVEKPIEKLKFVDVNKQQVLAIINSQRAKNSSDHDNISIKASKLVGRFISKPLTVIGNQSVSQCKFPDYCKEATVVPIYNAGEQNCLKITTQFYCCLVYQKFGKNNKQANN